MSDLTKGSSLGPKDVKLLRLYRAQQMGEAGPINYEAITRKTASAAASSSSLTVDEDAAKLEGIHIPVQ